MRLGSLCVIDVKPRNLDAEQLMVLANFAEVVVREIEKGHCQGKPSLPVNSPFRLTTAAPSLAQCQAAR